MGTGLTRIFHSHVISTGLQPGDEKQNNHGAASAALTQCAKPLKRLRTIWSDSTGLKPGVNGSHDTEYEISGLIPIAVRNCTIVVAALCERRQRNPRVARRS